MNTNRRQLRVVPDTLVFIQLEHDDGGKVLNVSEGGLSFEAFAPIPNRRGPIPFWFSLDLSDRIEVTGKLAWTDATRKVGGLRFLELSPSARIKIRNWISQSFKRKASAPESSGSEANTTVASSTSSDPVASSGTTELVPLERHHSATRQQFVRGILLGILVTSALAVPAVKYSHGGKQVGTPPPVAPAGQTAAANPESQGGVSVSGAGRGSIVKPRLQSLDNPSAGSSHALSVALSQTPETGSAKKNLASPQQLWSAVEGGNARAALTLADLYLRGEGVPVNCDQARVLLVVASRKGNAQAVKELRELDRTGCPVPAP